MKYLKLTSDFENKKFVIEEDFPEVGVYLLVYDEGRCIYDCLQDNIEACKAVAFEEYNVPLDAWNISTE
ncbi:MAG: hypothetical protein V3U71_11305 [Cocleimonas sp.]